MRITLTRALKRKKSITQQLEREVERLHRYNTTEINEVKKFSSKDSLEKALALSNELALIKAAIHKASTPIIEKKFKLATLKNLLYTVEGLGCVSGEFKDEKTKESITFISEITKDEKVRMLAKYEAEIERLEEELETFYMKTQIKI